MIFAHGFVCVVSIDHEFNARFFPLRNHLPWKTRAEEVTKQLREFLGDLCSFCEINPAGPECGGLTCFPLPASMTKEIFYDDPATFEQDHSRNEKDHSRTEANRVVVTIDNSTSPVHSLLQLSCKSRKGLLYDCLRTVKDFNLKVSGDVSLKVLEVMLI